MFTDGPEFQTSETLSTGQHCFLCSANSKPDICATPKGVLWDTGSQQNEILNFKPQTSEANTVHAFISEIRHCCALWIFRKKHFVLVWLFLESILFARFKRRSFRLSVIKAASFLRRNNTCPCLNTSNFIYNVYMTKKNRRHFPWEQRDVSGNKPCCSVGEPCIRESSDEFYLENRRRTCSVWGSPSPSRTFFPNA